MSIASGARQARLAGAVVRAFGENFTFTARKQAAADVDLPRIADDSRATFTAAGVWAGAMAEQRPEARGHASNRAHPVMLSSPSAWFEIATALPWMPVEGDMCRRDETEDQYAVALSIPDGFGGVTITFTAHKR